MLLNPFLLIIYFFEIIPKINSKQFFSVLLKSSFISIIIFTVFAFLGDIIFTNILQAKFASLQVFGGIIFLLIAIQFVFKGTSAIEGLRGEPSNLLGAIVMPVMVGPGTISVSIIIGKRLDILLAFIAIAVSVFLTSLIMYLLKILHDYIKPKNEIFIQRYIEIMGRIVPLIVGIFSIEMIFEGINSWYSILR
jgi:multiple antibiotic resistance protein